MTYIISTNLFRDGRIQMKKILKNRELLQLQDVVQATFPISFPNSRRYNVKYSLVLLGFPFAEKEEKELISVIDEMLGEYELEEIKLSLNDLQNAVKDSYYKVSISKINEIVKENGSLLIQIVAIISILNQ